MMAQWLCLWLKNIIGYKSVGSQQIFAIRLTWVLVIEISLLQTWSPNDQWWVYHVLPDFKHGLQSQSLFCTAVFCVY